MYADQKYHEAAEALDKMISLLASSEDDKSNGNVYFVLGVDII